MCGFCLDDFLDSKGEPYFHLAKVPAGKKVHPLHRDCRDELYKYQLGKFRYSGSEIPKHSTVPCPFCRNFVRYDQWVGQSSTNGLGAAEEKE